MLFVEASELELASLHRILFFVSYIGRVYVHITIVHIVICIKFVYTYTEIRFPVLGIIIQKQVHPQPGEYNIHTHIQHEITLCKFI